MTAQDEIKKMIRKKLADTPPVHYVLATEKDGYTDYSVDNFYRLNPDWQGKPEAGLAWVTWVVQSGGMVAK